MHNLDRFIKAQEYSYQVALQEVKSGYKRSHWMWYIFPQIAGLGRSAMAQMYAIASVEEAREYLEHPVLGERLREISRALLEHGDKSAQSIFGGIDTLKLRSSMTLFDAVAPGDVFDDVLRMFFSSCRDEKTLSIIS